MKTFAVFEQLPPIPLVPGKDGKDDEHRANFKWLGTVDGENEEDAYRTAKKLWPRKHIAIGKQKK